MTRQKTASGASTRTTTRLAVSYARVSSKEQEREGYSIPAQRALITGYAQQQGLTLLREFEDIETAKRAGRASFGQMVTFLKRHRRCRILLVEKIDRLTRNLTDWAALSDLDLEIHFIKDHNVHSRTSRSSDKLLVDMKMVIAKNFIDNFRAPDIRL